MKKKPRLLLAFLFCLYSLITTAQTDSAYYDLGRLTLRKDLTQSVTIKGKDLEKMPFSSLPEAINTWFSGAFTNRTNLIFVIDGNLVSDVNSWSIYDIEEITLVQNALVQINGTQKQQQLVLIKTKRQYEGKKGMLVAGQSSLVTRDLKNVQQFASNKSETNFYHQYQLSAYQNKEHVQFGISANYLRDVLPGIKSITQTPLNFNRYRLQGWMNVSIAKQHTLSLQMRYVPQVENAAQSYYYPGGSYSNISFHYKQSLINPTIRFSSVFSKEWSNDFNASYGIGRDKATGLDEQENNGSSPAEYVRTENYNIKSKNLVLRDQVTYKKQIGSWTLEPSLNFHFRHIEYDLTYNMSEMQGNQPVGFTQFKQHIKTDFYLLTPNVSVYQGSTFWFQAGILANLSKKPPVNKIKTIFPFVTASVDVLKLANPGKSNGSSLKLTGSWAQTGNFYEQPYTFRDYNQAVSYNPVINPFVFAISPSLIYPSTFVDVQNRILQAGATFSLPGNKFSISYNFDDRTFNEMYIIPIPLGGYQVIQPELKGTSHRLGILATITGRQPLQWQTGLNVTTQKTKIIDDLFLNNVNLVNLNDKPSWTGGWVNRFSYKNISLGASLLYLINESRLTTPPAFEKVNSFLLQNVYLSYRLHLSKLKGLEVYADYRNLAESDRSYLSDGRKYMGVGFKAEL